MRDRSILLVLSVLTICAFGCGADKAPPMLDYYGGVGGGTAQPGFCGTYCGTIVAKPTCQNYNDGSHCEQVCGWYRATVCTNEYSAFANCVQASDRTACYLSTSGKWGLSVPSACSTQFAASQKCINDNGVGVCPYGS
jgi:hypothetical protein